MGIYQKNGNLFSGRRLPQREIAAVAGVSISTVSRVLNHAETMSPDIKERVLSAASSLGYPLEANKIENITLFMVPTVTSAIAGQFEAGIVAGMDTECRNHGIRLTHMNISPDPDTSRFVIDMVKNNPNDGFIFLSQDNHALLEELRAFNHRVVLINSDDRDIYFDTVMPGYTSGARLAVQHLIKHGHKNILHVTSFFRSTLKQRYEAYRATLEEAGIAYDPALVLMLDGDLQVEKAYKEMQVFLAGAHPAFSAVFSVNDSTAIGIMRALQEVGLRIPQDVSIVGFDDIDFVAFMNPPLTTVRVECIELGKLAVRRLLERIDEPTLSPFHIELACRLVERQSVASLK